MSKTKLFLFGYFLPAWISALMMWGDDRTSPGFSPAPSWFVYLKFGLQILSILALFYPLKLRGRPSLPGFFLAIATLASLMFIKPALEADFIIVSSSVEICVLALFLCFAQPTAKLEKSDIAFLFFLFVIGFILQIGLFLLFGRLPSHSLTDVFVRFNGITNDSLATGAIVGALVPWAIKSRHAELKVMAIVGMAIASGSLFSAIFVPTAVIIYLLYSRLYKFAALVLAGIAGVGIVFYDTFARVVEIKLTSILQHLRFFLNIGGLDYLQSSKNCSEEFCESFVELGIHLNPLYLIFFYGLVISFLVQYVLQARRTAENHVMYDTLRAYGAALLMASLVHPIPIIPFAIPVFFIFASLYRSGTARAVSPRFAGSGLRAPQIP